MYPLMDTKGAMRADDSDDNFVPKKYRGLDRFVARKLVISDLDALNGLLIRLKLFNQL